MSYTMCVDCCDQQLTAPSPCLRAVVQCAPHPPQSQSCVCLREDCHQTALQQTQRICETPHCGICPLSHGCKVLASVHSQGAGFCPKCNTTLVSALTKGPVRPDDNGSLPSQSMLSKSILPLWCAGRTDGSRTNGSSTYTGMATRAKQL